MSHLPQQGCPRGWESLLQEVFGNKSGKPQLDARSWGQGLTDGGSGALDHKPSSVQLHGVLGAAERALQGHFWNSQQLLPLQRATQWGQTQVCGHRATPAALPPPWAQLSGRSTSVCLDFNFVLFLHKTFYLHVILD